MCWRGFEYPITKIHQLCLRCLSCLLSQESLLSFAMAACEIGSRKQRNQAAKHKARLARSCLERLDDITLKHASIHCTLEHFGKLWSLAMSFLSFACSCSKCRKGRSPPSHARSPKLSSSQANSISSATCYNMRCRNSAGSKIIYQQ